MSTDQPGRASTHLPLILLFGISASGKTTLARALAQRMHRSAVIEVDQLRYMIVGGLVASSAGIQPAQAPEEYQRQCALGVEQAVLLARNFATHGFASIIEGLEDDCEPGYGWQERTFPDRLVVSILVSCTDEVLRRRWRERSWGDVPAGTLQRRYDLLAQPSRFDHVVDTSHDSPETIAQRLSPRIAL
jgi:chloramphenicol 3-O-phosphotransferase